MSTDLSIYKQEFTKDDKGRNQILLTEIATTYDRSTIEELEQIGQRNWYVSSECGAIWELLGEELLPYLDKLHINKSDIDEEEWYRFNLSF